MLSLIPAACLAFAASAGRIRGRQSQSHLFRSRKLCSKFDAGGGVGWGLARKSLTLQCNAQQTLLSKAPTYQEIHLPKEPNGRRFFCKGRIREALILKKR